MNRKDLYKDKLQMDYFSENYLTFEEDFYKYSRLNTPLTFLVDDILLSMALSHKNYFKLNKENARDFQDHYFYFKIRMSNDGKQIRFFDYNGHKGKWELDEML